MSKELGSRPAPSNPELRQGDSARARFYRLKDELFDFPMDFLHDLQNSFPEKFNSIVDLYKPLSAIRVKLNQDENDEDALREGEILMRAISNKIDEYGISRYNKD